MSRRIDIELTSARDDGTWTWRAAGAKQPKGVLDAKLLYDGAKAGDVVRAEAEFEIEGITITQVTPPKGKRAEPERLELIGRSSDVPLVTSSLVPKSDRRRERGDRDGERRGPRREGERGGPRSDRPGRPPRPDGDRPSRPRGEGRGDRDRSGGGRDTREGREARPPREAREGRPPRQSRPAAAERPAPPKPKRLNPGHTHRTAVLETLAPEERPIAEQVLRGGIPSVRAAIEQENEKAKAEGRPAVNAEAIVAMAEGLLPRLKTAEWHDRADAAAQSVDEISLRDLRAVVTGADAAARDDETRTLASTLREALDRRVEAQRQEWVDEMERCLTEGRLVRALRVASRPPDPGSRFPTELAGRMAEAAGTAMAPDAPGDRWVVLIDAVANSPVRRQVTPAGLPAEPGEELLQRAREASGRIPALAKMLGIDMPPPPRPTRPAPGRAPARPGPRPAGGGRPVPPRPPKPARAAPVAPAEPTAAEPVRAEPTTPTVPTAPAEPAEPAQPTAAEPMPAEPAAPAEPTAAEPVPTEGAAAEAAPAAAEPTPADPARGPDQTEGAGSPPAELAPVPEPQPLGPASVPAGSASPAEPAEPQASPPPAETTGAESHAPTSDTTEADVESGVDAGNS